MSPNDIVEECNDMVFVKIEEWSQQRDDQFFYNESALLQHKQMLDIMQCNEAGDAKDNNFLQQYRNIDRLRMHVASTAAEHADPEDPDAC